jgi:hypothetical protein
LLISTSEVSISSPSISDYSFSLLLFLFTSY